MASQVIWKRQGSEYEAGCRAAPDELRRGLVRIANLSGADISLLLRARRGCDGYARVAGAVTSRDCADNLAASATQFPKTVDAGVDALTGDARMLVHRLSRPREGGFSLVLARHSRAVAFGADDLGVLASAFEWLEDIIDLWWSCERGAALSAALRAALAVGEVGFVLLDRRGVVIEFNPRAAQLLKRGNGLKACDGRLVAELDEDDARLRTAVVAATVAAGCGQMIEPVHLTVHRDGSRPLTVAVSVPYRQPAIHADDSDAVVLLQIADPDADTATVAESCALYDLTPSETRLCDQIVAGFSVNDAAATLGISVATARTYLKRVFAKTGVHRQADLVRLIIKSRVPTRRWRNSKISRLRTFKEASMPLEHFTLQKPSPLIVSDADLDSQLAMQFEAVRQT